jgi:hypothetical protein
MKTTLITMISLVLVIALHSCQKNDEVKPKSQLQTESEEMNIHQTGNENALTGNYKGTFGDDGLRMNLSNGKVTDVYEDYTYFNIHLYSDGGYIGYYSFDGTNLEAAINDGSPGAPITIVTRRFTGKVSGNTISGTTVYVNGQPKDFSITKKEMKTSIR